MGLRFINLLMLILLGICLIECKPANTSKSENANTMLVSNNVQNSFQADSIIGDDYYSFLFRYLDLKNIIIDSSELYKTKVFDIAYTITGLKDDEVEKEAINELSRINIVKLHGFDSTLIYHGKINNAISSEVYPESFYLFINEKKKQARLIWLDHIYLLKAMNDEFLLGGSYISHRTGVGYFLIFKFNEKSSPHVIFDSGLKPNSIYFWSYLNDFSCSKFKNDTLSFRNLDINNDGMMDIYFEGKVESYCLQGEIGGDISKRKRLSSSDVKVIYLTTKNNGDYKWVCADSSFVPVFENVKSHW